MRRLMYVLFGLLVFAGAAGLLYTRQIQVAMMRRSLRSSGGGGATRGIRSGSGDRRRTGVQRGERRIDRGINQYRKQDGSWNMFAAVLDVLNVVVGIVGIGLALSGMRARKNA